MHLPSKDKAPRVQCNRCISILQPHARLFETCLTRKIKVLQNSKC